MLVLCASFNKRWILKNNQKELHRRINILSRKVSRERDNYEKSSQLKSHIAYTKGLTILSNEAEVLHKHL